ncbi:MAG: hypothetical protein ABJG88_04115 [Litorimonas sp.]
MKIKAISIAIWRLFWALAFYPVLIGLMIWIYVKDHHWIWGVLLIIAALILDPMWRLITRRVINWRPHRQSK